MSSEVLRGVVRGLSLAPGLGPIGLVFGATAAQAGFSPAAVGAFSALVFAGGAQFAAVGIVAAGGAAMTAVALVFILNSRYLLLSAGMLELARQAGAKRLARVVLATLTVDETYALGSASATERGHSVARLMAMSLAIWVFWIAATTLGAIVGANLPDLTPYGVDYALPGIFVGLFGLFARTRPELIVGIACIGISALASLLGQGLLAVIVLPPTIAFIAGRLSS